MEKSSLHRFAYSQQGTKYVALQAGLHCFAGDNPFDRYGPIQNCNVKCGGNHFQMCGGGWANQVYQIST